MLQVHRKERINLNEVLTLCGETGMDSNVFKYGQISVTDSQWYVSLALSIKTS